MPPSCSYDAYMPFLAGLDLPDEKKHALIDTLWVMMSGLVDTHEAESFAAPHTETIPCGQVSKTERPRTVKLRNKVKWTSINTTHEFARASGTSAPPGEESP